MCLHGLVLAAADRNPLCTQCMCLVWHVSSLMLVVYGIIPFQLFCYCFPSPRAISTEYAKYYWTLSEVVKGFSFMNVANDSFLRYRYEQRPRGLILKMLRNGKHAGSASLSLPPPALPVLPLLPLVLQPGPPVHNFAITWCVLPAGRKPYPKYEYLKELGHSV